MAPDLISWDSNEYILEANQSTFIQANNDGPEIDSWEIEPQLPNGLSLLDNGSISGTPTHNTDWIEYTIWANNSGGSVGLLLWIVVHDLRADQEELLRGMGQTNWAVGHLQFCQLENGRSLLASQREATQIVFQ